MPKINFGKIGQALEENYNNSLKAQDDRTKQGLRAVQESQDEYRKDMQIMSDANKKKKSVNEFKLNLKSSLLIEAIYSLYDASLSHKIEYKNEAAIKRGLVTKFVNENNAENIINSFVGKSFLLSEYARIINFYTEAVTKDKNQVDNQAMDQEIKDEFYEDIFSDNEEAKDVALSIKMRVANAINDFNINNQEEKMDIENAINLSKAKIASAQTEELKEQYELDGNRAVFRLRQRKRNILESMVYNMGKSYYSNQIVKEQYSDDQGKIDMDSIIESCELMYGFLETLNTAKMVDVTEDYLENFVRNFSK